jgi:hypothetical protein
MPDFTHKELFTLVNQLIDERMVYPGTDEWKTQLSTSQVVSDRYSESVAREIPTDLNDTVASMVPPRIISGLRVIETSPRSDKVTVKAGSCVFKGIIWDLKTDTDIEIPFNSRDYTFYISMHEDSIAVDSSDLDDRMLIAKIVVPKPGTTNRVRNKRKTTNWDAYIVNYQEYKLYGDGLGNLEEDSVDLLRDALGDINASNIVGRMKISEGLKIENVAGSLKLDSNSMRIYDTSNNQLAKFNAYGTFFYNTNGVETARFTASDARIGNILITTSSVQSGNYSADSAGFRIRDTGNAEFNDVTIRGTIYATAGEIGGIEITSTYLQSSGFVSGPLGTGFRIESDGDAEFQNITARGKFTTSVFEKDTISSVGGSLLILDSDVLDADMETITGSLTIKGDTTFAVGDFLRIKDGVDDEWMEVTDISSAPTYLVTRDMGGQYSSGSTSKAWKKGTAVVNYGASGEGAIIMSSSEAYSPYIDFMTHSGDPWSSQTVKTRLGKLDGVAGASGWGIVAKDGYLGALEIIDNINLTGSGTIRTQSSVPYIELSTSGLQIKDNSTGGTYGTAVYSTDKYGYGAVAWIFNQDLGIPFAVLKEPSAGASDVADIRMYNRSDNPGGAAEVGDLCCVSGELKICTGAGTPGTWTIVGTQS